MEIGEWESRGLEESVKTDRCESPKMGGRHSERD